MNILEVKGLEKKYTGFTLHNISFELPAGYIMGYVGQNGAGKTTTINAITHLSKSDQGIIKVNGMEYSQDDIRYKDAIGFIGDHSYFSMDFSIVEIRKVLKMFYPSFQEQKFNELIMKWELPEKKKIKEYSRGMQVRLMFASVLSRDTKLLILDEATNGLDPVVKDEILSILQDYISDGAHSVLFSTHILADLEQIADYIFFIDRGEKVLFDTKEELLEKYVYVKGGLSDLKHEVEDKIIGIRKTGIGFEGLMESDNTVYLNKACIIEKPTINEIVICMIRSKGGKMQDDNKICQY